jgi:hypothetical protein
VFLVMTAKVSLKVAVELSDADVFSSLRKVASPIAEWRPPDPAGRRSLAHPLPIELNSISHSLCASK